MKEKKVVSPWVLITGVSSGIGLASAELLVSHGWNVIGTVREPEVGTAVLSRLGRGFYPIVLDVTSDRAEHDHAASQVRVLLAGAMLLGIVHNAGVASGGPLAFQPENEFRKMLETNVIGIFKFTQAMLPLLGQGSRMILISSVSGRLVTPFVGGYAASKFALEAMTDAYRHELGMLGIRVVSIQPGPVKTPIWSKAKSVGIPYAGTPYEGIMSRQDEMVAAAETGGMPVDKVAQVVKKALETPIPKTRYLIVRKKWLVLLAKYMPDRWKDRIIAARLEKKKKW